MTDAISNDYGGRTDPRKYFEIFDDFMGSGLVTSGNIGSLGWTKANINGGAGTSLGTSTAAYGCIDLNCGTSDTQGMIVALTASGDPSTGAGLTLNNGNFYFAARVKESATTNCNMRFGIISAASANTSPTPTDFIGFELETSTNAAWRGVTRSGGTSSFTGTTKAASVSFKSFYIIGNPGGTSYDFFSGTTALGTLTTNIPTNTDGEPFIQIISKSSTARDILVDYILLGFSGVGR